MIIRLTHAQCDMPGCANMSPGAQDAATAKALARYMGWLTYWESYDRHICPSCQAEHGIMRQNPRPTLRNDQGRAGTGARAT